MKKMLIIVPVLLLANCITGFRGVNYENVPKQNAKTLKKLSYRVYGSQGDPGAIERVLRHDTYFADSMTADQRPAKGVYVEVSIRQVNPSPGVIAWGYISYCTLFIIPSWDTDYGYDVTYDTYVDGEKVKQHDYQIKRGTYLSIFFLPFSWISLLRTSEEEAFEFTAHKYLVENRDFFQNLKR